MKKLILALSIFCFSATTASAASDFQISSSDFKDGKALEKKYEFNGFGCDGKNIAPSVKWKNAPKETKSFAFTVYDPDAPTGSGWWHFASYNIAPNVSAIKNAQLPQGALAVNNDGGSKPYMGPCPPKGHGTHHYIFSVFALNVEKLELPQNASAALLGYMINQHKIAEAKITATYERK